MKEQAIAITYRTKGQIVRPGEYVAIPRNLLADPNIAPGAKNIFAALVDHLRGRSVAVWPSTVRLGGITGQSERTVRRQLIELARAGYLEPEYRPGLSTKYRFPDRQNYPGQNDRTQNNPGQNDRPDKMAGTPDKMAGTPVKVTDETTLEATGEQLPPAAAIFPDSNNGEKPDDDRIAIARATKRIALEYAQAFGVDMPAAWIPKIAQEYAQGDRATVAAIDAAGLSDASADIEKRGLGFYFTNVANYVHSRRKKKAAGDARRHKAAQAAAERLAEDKRRQADQDAAAAIAEQRLAAFRTLQAGEQSAWITKAVKRFPKIKRSDRIENMAAYIADQDGAVAVEIEA